MLSIAGVSAYHFSPWIAVAVVVLMFTVVASYRQNVHAYPSGGGDYEVATTNLGPKAGLTVASALLVDYVLTVAVSISSGVENLGSAVPFVVENKTLCAVGAIVLLTLMNLRGVKESGKLFAVPTYLFVAGVFLMILWGSFRGLVLGDAMHAPPPNSRSNPSTRGWPDSPSSSFSCGPSPPAAPPSPASRRSATAYRPSASRRARTPRPRWR